MKTNRLFWAKAEEFLYSRIFDAKVCKINPQQYIEMLEQDIYDLRVLLEQQQNNNTMEGFL